MEVRAGPSVEKVVQEFEGVSPGNYIDVVIYHQFQYHQYHLSSTAFDIST